MMGFSTEQIQRAVEKVHQYIDEGGYTGELIIKKTERTNVVKITEPNPRLIVDMVIKELTTEY